MKTPHPEGFCLTPSRKKVTSSRRGDKKNHDKSLFLVSLKKITASHHSLDAPDRWCAWNWDGVWRISVHLFLWKSAISDPKTGVDVNFCAAVPKMRPKYTKILFFNAQNRGRCEFLCRDTFRDPKYSKILFFNVQNRGRKVVLHESVTDARTDTHTHGRTAFLDKSEYEEAPLASFRS